MKKITLAIIIVLGLCIILFNPIFLNKYKSYEGVVKARSGDIGADQFGLTKGYGQMEIKLYPNTILLTDYDKDIELDETVRCSNRNLRYIGELIPRYSGKQFTCKEVN